MAPPCQTTKQAKAAFRARNGASVTQAELRQLERSLELQRRAELAKEREAKRKALLLQKKEREKESAAKMALDQGRRTLGTQRTVDRFGYKSSQFHLLGFFGKGVEKNKPGLVKQEAVVDADGSGVVLDNSVGDNHGRPGARHQATRETPSLRGKSPAHQRPSLLQNADIDMLAMFASGTQIQRELTDGDLESDTDCDEPSVEPPGKIGKGHTEPSQNTNKTFASFTSDDWLLESDDIEKLDAAVQTSTAASTDHQSRKRKVSVSKAGTSDPTQIESKARVDSFLMPPPARTPVRAQSSVAQAMDAVRVCSPHAVKGRSRDDTSGQQTRRPLQAIRPNRAVREPTRVSVPKQPLPIKPTEPLPPILKSGSTTLYQQPGPRAQHRKPFVERKQFAATTPQLCTQTGFSMSDLEDLAGMDCQLTQAPTNR